MTKDAREALRAAQLDLAQAESTLEAAQKTVTRAQALLETIVREAKDHEAAEMRVSTSLASEMKAALMTGAALSVSASDREMAKSAAARATLETRRQTAEQVVAELAGEEREAYEAVAMAREAVGEAMRGVLRATAAQISARWEAVEAEALTLRERLGRFSGAVWRIGAIDDASSRALQANSDTSFRELDRLIETQWVEFGAALLRDPEARIDFAPVDDVRAAERDERENDRRAVEAINARMRTSRLAEAHS
jgi:hypothetical protein